MGTEYLLILTVAFHPNRDGVRKASRVTTKTITPEVSTAEVFQEALDILRLKYGFKDFYVLHWSLTPNFIVNESRRP